LNIKSVKILKNVLNKVLNKVLKLFSKRKKKKKRFIDDWELNSIKKSKEDEINRILDKLNKSGINSLTESELIILKKYK
jgi:Ca2+-binding EF-hand superfamily protein